MLLKYTAMVSKEEECCVCLKNTENVISPCLHVMCKTCILKWSSKKLSCPICMTTIVSPCPTKQLTRSNTTTRQMTAKEDVMLGLTLKEVADGLYILNVDDNSAAEKMGLKYAQTITHVNDIPIKKIQDVKKIVAQAQRTKHILQFTLLRPPLKPCSKRYLFFPCFHYRVHPC